MCRPGFKRGHALIEFVMMLPLFFLIFLGILDLSLMVLEQFSLENLTRRVCRKLALSDEKEASSLAAAAQIEIQKSFRNKVHVEFSLREIPAPPPPQRFKAKKKVQVLRLTSTVPHRFQFPLLSKVFGNLKPRVKAHVREIRVLSVSGLEK